MSNKQDGYVGLDNDQDGGITYYGRVVLDARVFGLIPPDETCAGWGLQRLQVLVGQVDAEWDRYGNIPSRLPEELRAKHEAEYARQISKAREKGWDPEANLEDH
ncbi:hypothetical protein P8631_06070 [Guyparkeria sp. 1SP6A2]|nr:hypothetical protein [Guyparkeria sp. 1SP6A2]